MGEAFAHSIRAKGGIDSQHTPPAMSLENDADDHDVNIYQADCDCTNYASSNDGYENEQGVPLTSAGDG